jgi:hypothetical protein
MKFLRRIEYLRNVLFIVALVALFMSRMHWPGSALLKVLSFSSVVVYSLILGLDHIKAKRLWWMTDFWLAYTFVGMLFRHMWWPFPMYAVIFIYLWPFITLLLAFVVYNKKTIVWEPIGMKLKWMLGTTLVLASTTFLLPSDLFARVYKNRTMEQIEEEWRKQEQMREIVDPRPEGKGLPRPV